MAKTLKLKTYLNDNFIRLAPFSAETGISIHTLGKYKNGRRIPRPEHAQKIYDATKGQVTPNDFYGLREREEF